MKFSDLNFSDIKEFLDFVPNEHNFAKNYKYKIRNQKTLPNCTSHAWVTCIEYLRQIDGFPYENFSVLYQYYMSRRISGYQCQIKGLKIEKSLESLFNDGLLKSSGKEINMNTINTCPSNLEINEAKNQIINGIFCLLNLEINVNVFKYVLSQMYIPIVAVIETDNRLFNKEPKIFIGDNVKELNHAICIVGYDDEEQVFIFQNSYGSKWHYNGFGKIHYSFLSNITKAISLDRSCIKSCELNGDYLNDYLKFMDINNMKITDWTT